ncbi:MAG TPA: hypothetical protein VFZ66_04905 [Herpetosiphonaceae bacterium]
MTDKQVDPANESIKQGRHETHTYEGQEGYGVKYEDGQYRDGTMQDTPQQGRSGSYETNNLGGYGTGQPDAEGQTHSAERPVLPPDPEAQQGQGGQ